MNSYTGIKVSTTSNDIFVIRDGLKSILDPVPSQQLINHSPIGFDWGHHTPGSHQAALGILLDLLGPGPAISFYLVFEIDVVSKFGDKFCISGGEIRDWLRKVQAS